MARAFHSVRICTRMVTEAEVRFNFIVLVCFRCFLLLMARGDPSDGGKWAAQLFAGAWLFHLMSSALTCQYLH